MGGRPRYPTIGHDERVTGLAKRVVVLAPMQPELKAIVKSFGLRSAEGDDLFTHAGSAGDWSVVTLVTGMGPAVAREATQRALAAGPCEHVMVVGIAGGLDPELPVGSLMVPTRVQLYPNGPEYRSHPLPPRRASGGLMTTDGLFDDDDVWRPILERGFGAVDMEAAGVAEACENAGVAWSVYRGISDRPDEHIVDQAVFALSKPDGSADPVALAKYLARDPRRAKALAHLNKCMQAAAKLAADAAFADLVGA
jgi:adenosylhomocysteine nucleosidase